jgi:hypothetical protein
LQLRLKEKPSAQYAKTETLSRKGLSDQTLALLRHGKALEELLHW